MEVLTFELNEVGQTFFVQPLDASGKPLAHPLADEQFDHIDKAHKAAKKAWPKAQWVGW